jgi:hypothetical protein
MQSSATKRHIQRFAGIADTPNPQAPSPSPRDTRFGTGVFI